MSNLVRASRELFSRTPDETFDSFDQLYQYCSTLQERSMDRWEPPQSVTPAILDSGQLGLSIGSSGQFALNDWSFGQLCGLSRLDKQTINRIQTPTAMQAFHDTLPKGRKPLQILTTDDRVRSVHGVSYTRLFNPELLDMVRDHAGDFTPPQKGFNGATGLYAGEQDMFCFMIDPSGWVEIGGESFAPGFFLWNSEVGRRTVGIETFWFQSICANHIVWDAMEVTTFSRKHTANVHDALPEITGLLKQLVASRDQRREPARRCSNLDSALQHACDYEEVAFGVGAAATLSGLILHLENLANEGKDLRYTSQGHDAVTLMSYHGSKGLEWPVVVLSGLHASREVNMWSPVVTGGSAAESDPLAGRELRSWTWPFGESDGPYGGLKGGSQLETDALISPEGTERTLREQNENLRLLYVGCTRAKQKLVFAHRSDKYDWLAHLDIVDTVLDPDLDEGEHRLNGIETTYVVRRLGPDMANALTQPAANNSAWISLVSASTASTVAQRYHSPSLADAVVPDATFNMAELPGSSFFPAKAEDTQFAAIGIAVHSYMASLPSIRTLPEADKLLVAERCLAAYAVSGLVPSSVLVSAGERFSQWIESRFPEAVWHVEVPLSGVRFGGGRWAGTADLLLQLPCGRIVVVDHKSAPIRREHCASKAVQFSGQLTAYAEVLKDAGETIRTSLIHFPLAGVICELNQAF